MKLVVHLCSQANRVVKILADDLCRDRPDCRVCVERSLYSFDELLYPCRSCVTDASRLRHCEEIAPDAIVIVALIQVEYGVVQKLKSRLRGTQTTRGLTDGSLMALGSRHRTRQREQEKQPERAFHSVPFLQQPTTSVDRTTGEQSQDERSARVIHPEASSRRSKSSIRRCWVYVLEVVIAPNDCMVAFTSRLNVSGRPVSSRSQWIGRW